MATKGHILLADSLSVAGCQAAAVRVADSMKVASVRVPQVTVFGAQADTPAAKQPNMQNYAQPLGRDGSRPYQVGHSKPATYTKQAGLCCMVKDAVASKRNSVIGHRWIIEAARKAHRKHQKTWPQHSSDISKAQRGVVLWMEQLLHSRVEEDRCSRNLIRRNWMA